MRLTEFLSQSMVKIPLAGLTKREVLQELVEVVCQDQDDSVTEHVLQSVLERERLMSSGIGRGIGLPHGYSPGGMEFAAAMGVCPEPIPFDAIDGQPVRLVFLLISDEEHLNTKLKALARVSRFLHREDFRTALMECTSPADAMRVIAEEEARHRI
ncbi:MAG: PTS sugar transporter subunit IIA [bacterium]|nr:PTS sugar transporter subunit IIA [bacterium]